VRIPALPGFAYTSDAALRVERHLELAHQRGVDVGVEGETFEIAKADEGDTESGIGRARLWLADRAGARLDQHFLLRHVHTEYDANLVVEHGQLVLQRDRGARVDRSWIWPLAKRPLAVWPG